MEFYHLTKKVLESRNINLRKWNTNDLESRNFISQDKNLKDVQIQKADESA